MDKNEREFVRRLLELMTEFGVSELDGYSNESGRGQKFIARFDDGCSLILATFQTHVTRMDLKETLED